MKIVIGGCGALGAQLIKMLNNEGHDIVVIETDQTALETVTANYDVLGINGSITSFSSLIEAGVKDADLFVAVARELETNITACILAKRLGAEKTVARIDSSEYLQPTNRAHCIGLGVDALVYPQMLAAREIVNLISQTGTSEVFNFSNGMLSLYVIKLIENAPVIGKTLREVSQIENELNYRAVAISRHGKTFIPKSDEIFHKDDVVFVISTPKGIQKITQYSGQQNIIPENIMILGGSRLGIRTASTLENQANIKLIEIDKPKCFELSELLPETLVLNGDGRDTELLRQEGIEKTDVFIAVTGNSETNILTCLQAKKMGVRKTIAAVESLDYIPLAENLGIDAIINKKIIAASYILRFTINADVTSFMCLLASDAEVFEFIVRPGAKITKGKLKEIDFPKEATIGGVVRNKTSFIATGDTHIKANDHVVVFTLPNAVGKLEEFFN